MSESSGITFRPPPPERAVKEPSRRRADERTGKFAVAMYVMTYNSGATGLILWLSFLIYSNKVDASQAAVMSSIFTLIARDAIAAMRDVVAHYFPVGDRSQQPIVRAPETK